MTTGPQARFLPVPAAVAAAALAAVLAAGGAPLVSGAARADSWYDGARHPHLEIARQLHRRQPDETGSLIVDSHAYAREHGFEIMHLNPLPFSASRGDEFNYVPKARIYIPPTPGTSDRGHGRKSIAPAAVILHPNYSLYGNYSRRFGRRPLTLEPTGTQLRGATPRVLRFESRGRR